MATSDFDALEQFLLLSRQRCDSVISACLLNLPAMPEQLCDAMRYSALQGGKRLRPALVYASAIAAGGSLERADAAAAAAELLHCYSLIHDDLPAMDNDDLRRGQPTLHKAYDEATAILAGDALQSLCFQLLAEQTQVPAAIIVRMVSLMARAGGCDGMIAGQGIDLAAVGKQLSLSELENMHRLKTGALICACVELGALSSGCEHEESLTMLREYARCIGLAFQVQDDILDVTSDTDTLGKTQGADMALNKPTYVSLLGLDGAILKADELVSQALGAITQLKGNTRMLAEIATYITRRRH
jgi:geranylgeranyl pyrophosphate synthase